ncbi:hypothetical protein [Fretibacter rubidus]|uniref:hypothetical protein n=1 Tax=Fretibacter rubidus TaxID=570162 RepID=UPI00352B8996
MGNGPIPKSVKAHMATDETVLWSHVSDKPVKLSDAYERRPSRRYIWLSPIAAAIFIICLFLLVKDYADTKSALRDVAPLAVYNLVLLGFLNWYVYKFPAPAAMAHTLQSHGLYQNLVMTNRQLIAFNDTQNILSVPNSEVTSLKTDFENGGPALRIQSPSLGQDIVVVGLANFQTATHQFHANNGLHT